MRNGDRRATLALAAVGLAACGPGETGGSGSGTTGTTETTATAGSGTDTGGAIPPCEAGLDVFDEGTVHDLILQLDPADWTAMQAEQAASPEYGGPKKTYFPSSMTFDGTELPGQVGLRVKGHYSLITAEGHQFPMKVDFNRVVPTQKYEGLGKLNLHPAAEEGAGSINEFLSYGAMRAHDIPTARTSFARVTVNGEDLGPYNLVEQIDGRFIRCHYPEPHGQLYKPEEGNGDLHYAGPAFADYPTVEHKWPAAADHTAFLNMVTVVNTGDLTQFPDVLDMTGVLTYFAANTGVGTPDTYASTGHNYYLYEVTPGRFTMIPWDQNISQFDAADPCGVAGRNGPDFPLSHYPLGDPTYTAEYAEILLGFLGGSGSKQALGARLDIALARLGAAVPRWVPAEYAAAIDTRVSGLEASVPGLVTCP